MCCRDGFPATINRPATYGISWWKQADVQRSLLPRDSKTEEGAIWCAKKFSFSHTNWTRIGASLKAPLRPGCSQLVGRVRLRRQSPVNKGLCFQRLKYVVSKSTTSKRHGKDAHFKRLSVGTDDTGALHRMCHRIFCEFDRPQGLKECSIPKAIEDRTSS
jgi:hypothetical protein